MNTQQRYALYMRETDVTGAIRRFNGDETLYESCLKMFLDDKTVEQLNTAIEKRQWDEAFTAAHALKGLAGNMGFVPLLHSTGQLVVLIRGGRVNDIHDCLASVNSCYRDICDAIKMNF